MPAAEHGYPCVAAPAQRSATFILTLVMGLLLPWTGSAAGGQPQLLTDGQSVTQHIGPGQEQAFRSAAQAERWLVVEQLGMDVVVVIAGTDLRTPSLDRGAVVASVAPGDEIVIRPAAHYALSGRYRLTLVVPADTDWRTRWALYCELRATRAHGGARHHEAATFLLWAWLAWQGLGADERAAAADLGSALSMRLAGAPRLALLTAHRAHAFYARRGDRSGRASAAGQLAFLHEQVNEPQAAEARAREAVDVLGGAGLELRLASAHNNLGLLLHGRGRLKEAEQHYRQALALNRQHGAGDRISTLLNNLGGIAYVAGEPALARTRFQAAIDAARTRGLDRPLSDAVGNLALLETSLGNVAEALRLQLDALDFRRRDGDVGGEARALQRIGDLYWKLGQWSRAEQFLAQSRTLRERIGDLPGLALSFGSLAEVALEAGDPKRAARLAQRAMALQEQAGYPLGQALVSLTLARIALADADYDAAERAVQSARALAERAEAPRPALLARLLRGEMLLRAARPAEAVSELEGLSEALDERGDALNATTAQFRLGLGLAATGRSAAAAISLRQAAERAEHERSGLQAPEWRASHWAVRQAAMAELELLLAEAATDDAALYAALGWGERRRARALHDRDVPQSAALVAAREVLLAKSRLADELPAAAPATRRAATLAAMAEARSRYELLRDSVDGGALLDVRAMVAAFDAQTVLYAYSFGATRAGRWSVVDGRLAFAALPLSTLEADLAAYGQALDADERAALARLGGRLAAALLHGLPPTGVKRLVVLTEGALAGLPFAALPDPAHPGKPLVERLAVIHLPALRDRLGMRPATGRQADSMAIWAVSRPALALPPLPGAATEARVLGALFGARAVLHEGGAATPASLLGSKASLLHVAAHGVHRRGMPWASGLALRADAADMDGLLSVERIAGATFPARLAVLSACASGTGDEHASEGVGGMAHAFLRAGVPAVIATSTAVRDGEALQLMSLFYRRLDAGLAPAEALQSAQSALAKRMAVKGWSAFRYFGAW